VVLLRIYNHSDNPLPAYKHSTDAGFDLYANESVIIQGGDIALVDSGIRIDVPVGYEAQIRLRSSFIKREVFIPNAPGTIDSGYTGPVMVALHNLRPHLPFELKKGERFAQIVINKLPNVEIVEVTKDEFFSGETPRGEGGFGSTGKW